MEKHIFIFDENKCVGCGACVVACMNENGFQPGERWRNVYQSNSGHRPTLPVYYLSIACNHCDDAPCMEGCPALAFSRDPETGAVIHQPEKCLGCKYCTWTCPYDAPKYKPESGLIEKCTFCNHRLEADQTPACAQLCPTAALTVERRAFGRDESMENNPVPVDAGARLKIVPSGKQGGPEMDQSLFEGQKTPDKIPAGDAKISAMKEWPLLLFTLISAGMVGVFASGLLSTAAALHQSIFAGSGFVAAALSMFHPGQKSRAWRALLNLKNSWLSREILLFTLFFIGVICDFWLIDLPNFPLLLTGILLLFSMDMLYLPATYRWPFKIHSAQALFIALNLLTILQGWLLLFAVISAFRLHLYFYRKLKAAFQPLPQTVVRISLLIFSVIAAYWFDATGLVLLYWIPGELIDRIEFYNELEVPGPESTLRLRQ